VSGWAIVPAQDRRAGGRAEWKVAQPRRMNPAAIPRAARAISP
jgi:hypothetical protein